jgi:hypothetical protein
MLFTDGGSHCLVPELTLLGDTKWLKLALICAHVVAASYVHVLSRWSVLHPKKGHKKKINVCATIEKMVKRKKG